MTRPPQSTTNPSPTGPPAHAAPTSASAQSFTKPAATPIDQPQSQLQPPHLLSQADQQLMLKLARQSIAAELAGQDEIEDSLPADTISERCVEQGSSFVTLLQKNSHQLRGCIGSLTAYQPLFRDICEHARAAAVCDPRFAPVTALELEDLDIEISVISQEIPIACLSEAQLLEQLKPGIDGLTLRCDQYQATFLPSVWRQIPEPREFVQQLKLKAGLNKKEWPEGMRAFRYYSSQFGELDIGQKLH